MSFETDVSGEPASVRVNTDEGLWERAERLIEYVSNQREQVGYWDFAGSWLLLEKNKKHIHMFGLQNNSFSVAPQSF